MAQEPTSYITLIVDNESGRELSAEKLTDVLSKITSISNGLYVSVIKTDTIVDGTTERQVIPNTILNFTPVEVDVAAYEVQSTDSFLHVTYTTTGSCTITIPTSELSRKNIIVIKDAGFNAGTNNITIQTEGTEKIDGQDTAVISSDDTSISLYPYNNNWFIF